MSNDSSESVKPVKSSESVPWNPWLGAVYVVFLFPAAHIFSGLLVSLWPVLLGWSTARARDWLKTSVDAQFAYHLLAAAIVLGGLYFFFKIYKTSFKSIGLRRFKPSDLVYSLLAFPVYLVILLAVAGAAKALFPDLDLNQAQDLGLNGSYYGIQLVQIAIMLVVLPPLIEEIVFRGMLFGSLKKAMPLLAAALTTSLLFAAGHLTEGGSGGLLYVGAIDTFVLSLILIYLREKTGGLWSSIGLHAIKNGVAFLTIFILHAR